MKNTVKTYEEEGTKYQFDSKQLMICINQRKHYMQLNGRKITKTFIMEDLADTLCVSSETVKSWMYGYNGPSEIDQVKALGDYFRLDYHQLLKSEVDNMSNAVNSRVVVVNDAQAQITKECVRAIYRKMLEFIRFATKEKENMSFVEDEDFSEEQNKGFCNRIYEIHDSLQNSIEDIVELLEYYELDFPEKFSKEVSDYIWTEFVNVADSFKPSPRHDRFLTEYSEEELKAEIEEYDKFTQEIQDYLWEKSKKDMKQLFSDYYVK